jgi:mannose-6-phosphate isomerase-like protein (cupin superfamily)
VSDLSALQPFVLHRDDGDATWFLGTLMTVKAGDSASRSAYTLIEFQAPSGFAPPLHVHHREDEAFYVLEGSLRVTCGEQAWTIGPGDFAFLPRGIPHLFTVEGDRPVRALQITSPAGFERFVAEVGEPAAAPALPPRAAPDLPKLLAAAAEHSIEIFPPRDV